MSSGIKIIAGLVALSVSTADAAVKGARVSLVAKTAAVLHLTIENHRNSPMVEWQIGLFSHSGEPQGRNGDLYTLDDLIRQANASPERIGQIAQSMHDVLERQRSRLVRHLTR